MASNSKNAENRKCKHELCEVRPSFNKRGIIGIRFCAAHKEDGMIYVQNYTCEYTLCEKKPVFNTRGQKKGRFCAAHKEFGMIDIISKTCEHQICETPPVFNKRGEIGCRFCAAHKEDGMIDVINNTCEHVLCRTRPSYSTRGQKKGRFCWSHKELGMIDVISKRCERELCEKGAGYGPPGFKPLRCAEHKEPGMMANSRARCKSEKCKELALYGIRKPIHCDAHKMEGDENFVERPCFSCGLSCVLNNKNLCESCGDFCRARLAKQREVMQYLDVHLNDFPPASTDKVPLGLKECGDKERPDRLWDSHPTRVVILEVDENQHKERNCECEQTRMINIAQSLGAPQTIYMRYNPDPFKSSESRYWNQTKRLKKLTEWLRFMLEFEKMDMVNFDGTIGVVYLFFDGYKSTDLKVRQLL
jgi:hypothetical protein